jgi:2-polyprenyl-6-methoxyphenol hydroxylase-like FAD-dependent oxidoreductase
MTARPDFDVAIVGASIAGCAAATLLARAGGRVALIERKPSPEAFKRVCGHYIQPSAVGAIERLGLMPALERAGAFRGTGELWTRHGWIRRERDGELLPSLSVRRSVLDPLLRRTAAATPGVELLAGHTLEALNRDRTDTARLDLRAGASGPVSLTARLVVGADGRGSRTAELAGLPTRRSANVRSAWFGYFEGNPLDDGIAVRLWFLEPDVGIVTPTDGGLTLCVAMPHRVRAPEFKRDAEGTLRRFIAQLPDGPDISDTSLVGPMIGKVDMTSERRAPATAGLALVGDAALAQDPVAAIGCGWALQSAEWLADAVAAPLIAGDPIDTGLARYAKQHTYELAGHARLLDSFAARERLNPAQSLLFAAGTRDRTVAKRLGELAGRTKRPSQLLTPALLARAALTNARAKLTPTRAPQPAPAKAAG